MNAIKKILGLVWIGIGVAAAYFLIIDQAIPKFESGKPEDMRTQKEVKHYSKILDQVGYDSHPMKVAARRFAKKYRDTCFKTFKNDWL